MNPAIRDEVLALYRSGQIAAAISRTLALYPGMTRIEAQRALRDLVRDEGRG